MRFDLKSYIHKSAKYFLVGLVTTGIFLGGLPFFTETLGIHYIISTILAFTLATVVGFFGQKYFTFKNKRTDYLGQLLHFILVAILGLAINTSTVYLFEDILKIGYMAGAVLSSGIVFLVKFPLNNFFTFKEQPLAENSEALYTNSNE